MNKPPWNLNELYEIPAVYPASEQTGCEIRALFYQGVPYQGRETRIFAYYGVPSGASSGDKVPGIVLLHGGAGTAFSEWVKKWTARGYAAIAMDLEGHTPYVDKNSSTSAEEEWPCHRWSGPAKQGVFADYDQPLEDQWMYHAVAAAVVAHSLLRSFPEVDESRIGITGISWGGIITSLVSGLDTRLSFAMPIYGCGFLSEPLTVYGKGFALMPSADAERLSLLWDPATYLPQSRLPMLWLNGSNDTHFPLSIFIKSYELNRKCHPASTLSLHYGLGHSYVEAWSCEEAYAFADSVVKGEPKLAEMMEMRQEGEHISVPFISSLPVKQAVLYWCKDNSDWRQAIWQPIAAFLKGNNEAIASLPDEKGSFFMNLTNDRGWTTSTIVMVDNRP
ncbi:hypothetical protein BBD42_05760 [Paenibacillus sp. BIHB 4019]|uniref:Acetyl xylan esterase domain-containing protein n=1 Tax=Paenibacillus sp. BIHB 4019 TaxID=1870819 RepID=A0A1B2DE69_9BACL|nr:acetylxylan esterase [Paenibacillus sp. BIHB 4019]ANY66018.1 hypothetical protein BBD42_05760 [Paenibacillus sp. BIHB 4019]